MSGRGMLCTGGFSVRWVTSPHSLWGFFVLRGIPALTHCSGVEDPSPPRDGRDVRTVTTIYCPRCDSRHDPAGAPWCAPARNVPAIPGVYGTLGSPALQPPAAESGGPAPEDLELFADHEGPAPAADEAAGRRRDGVGAELVPVRPRSRHRRYKPRSRRLAGLAAAGMTVLSGGLLAANAMGGGGGARTDEAVARADTPVQPLPTEEPDADDGSATPDGDRPSGAAQPDGAEPTGPRPSPSKASRGADRPTESTAPTTSSPSPTATTPAEGRVSAPDTAEPESSAPSTATPTPTPSAEGGSGGSDGSGGSGGDSDDDDSGGGLGLGLDLPFLPGL